MNPSSSVASALQPRHRQELAINVLSKQEPISQIAQQEHWQELDIITAVEKARNINHDRDLSSIDVALLDELFHGPRPVLTGVDADSTYCFLLEAVSHRDEDTWGYYLLEASAQGLNPDYTIADAGKGIRAGQKAAWENIPLILLFCQPGSNLA